jgi:hypothetical protein
MVTPPEVSRPFGLRQVSSSLILSMLVKTALIGLDETDDARLGAYVTRLPGIWREDDPPLPLFQ